MPQADGPTNAIKETPQQLTEQDLEQDDKYLPQQDEMHGNGAGDKYDNSKPGEITGGDTDRHGIKPPDAMGAGA